MYTIGSYAIPQIQTVNPDMDIDSRDGFRF